ncbi:MAG: cytochrome c bioproteinis protein, transmembrane region [Candidatus Berkelbacteria bacterium Licking1014_85]|uniref:Cytochrome c bioproteinis protein, transmembrane region n=1 Tax=Candidatus Berkelbacteria bacterium Licking1014_85 TaxID=2017148 RepID=A0A554LLR4_9BACT|nr:MAG: cytochrome c bioproteinis protein, transmembrane region [Candidatus Berkelbacteria bacterium Licking1014_85]
MNFAAMFFAGLTDSYNPCSIGVLLISLTILVGLGKRKLIVIFGISYLAMIFLTYFIIGLGLLRAFHLFGVHGFFGYLAGIILIIAGLAHLAPARFRNLPIINLLSRCYIPTGINQHLEKGVFISGIILGFLIGLCTVPCAGGIYLGAIALLATNANFWSGLIGILFFNIGFILPLIIIFLIATRPKVLEKIKLYNKQLSQVSKYYLPAIMIVLGIILIYFAKLK